MCKLIDPKTCVGHYMLKDTTQHAKKKHAAPGSESNKIRLRVPARERFRRRTIAATFSV